MTLVINFAYIFYRAMVQPGTMVKLMVARKTPQGVFLADSDCEVFLPSMECPEAISEGDVLEVFVFPTTKGELEATLKKPLILLNGVKKLLIKDSTPFGAFADIGIRVDLHLPPGEQLFKVEDKKAYVMTMQYDLERNKLYGSTRISRYIPWHTRGYPKGAEVDIVVLEKEESGFKVVVNEKTFGFLPFSETYRQIRMGESYKAYIKKIEPKSLVLSLQKEGLELIEDAAERIIAYLNANSGYARLGDDSDPEEIKMRLHMSKKAFKKGIGYLQKRGQLVITKRGIKIAKNNESENSDSEL